MFFMLRSAFCIGLVLVLVADRDKAAPPAIPGGAAARLARLCADHPGPCLATLEMVASRKSAVQPLPARDPAKRPLGTGGRAAQPDI
jgi:hypothetical protein